jgi:hypothetical protein
LLHDVGANFSTSSFKHQDDRRCGQVSRGWLTEPEVIAHYVGARERSICTDEKGSASDCFRVTRRS